MFDLCLRGNYNLLYYDYTRSGGGLIIVDVVKSLVQDFNL